MNENTGKHVSDHRQDEQEKMTSGLDTPSARLSPNTSQSQDDENGTKRVKTPAAQSRRDSVRTGQSGQQSGYNMSDTWGFVEDEAMEQRAAETYLSMQHTTSEKDPEQKMFELLDIAPMIRDGMSALVQDSFTPCFEEPRKDPWNFNAYLFIFWIIGCVFRYAICLPFRLIVWMIGSAVYFIRYGILKLTLELAQFYCKIFVMSWSGVIKYHGIIPKREPNQIYVCNHTTVFDICVLMQNMCFSIIGQQHNGVLGWFQREPMACLDCIWFDRKDVNDRARVSQMIKEHIRDPEKIPLLIFPEGTCVNNEYCVQFKKGAFEMGATICPIAIKYNLDFSIPFWNSRTTSFVEHFINLCASWAVVADVWYLPPQRRADGETAIEFAARVRKLIIKKAGLRDAPWDGYLKYFKPQPRFTEEMQKKFAESLTSIMTSRIHVRSKSQSDCCLNTKKDDDLDNHKKLVSCLKGSTDDDGLRERRKLNPTNSEL